MRVIDADNLIIELQRKIRTQRSTIEIQDKLIPMIKEMETVDPAVYEGAEAYNSKPVQKNPLLDELCENDRAALIAWFRCNSCPTCAFRERVLPKINRSVHWCASTHDRRNIIDMISTFGYSRE